MQNCHGRTVLHFLMDYWTVSKFHPTGKTQMFYVVLNSIGEYIHLIIKPVLNSRALLWLEVHVQLTITGPVTFVNNLKLVNSVKANSCGFSQMCTKTIASIYFRGQC